MSFFQDGDKDKHSTGLCKVVRCGNVVSSYGLCKRHAEQQARGERKQMTWDEMSRDQILKLSKHPYAANSGR